MISEKITFGTDGFRGVIGDNFNYENVRRIAQGFSDWLGYKGFKKDDLNVFIGYDRRFLSDKFASEFAVVLLNNGIKCVVSKTPVPTPMVSYLTLKDYKFGVVITASHNPYYYNGVKIKYMGRSAVPQMTSEIELYIEKNAKSYIPRTTTKHIEFIDERAKYLNYINERFNVKNILSKIKGKIVFDLMYSSMSDVFEMVFGGYKNIVAINTKHDPLFGEYLAPEPVEKRLFKLKEKVKEEKSVCGFAVDGDGDRFALFDEEGRYLTPQQVAPMILEYLIEVKKLKGRVVQAVSLGYLTKKIAGTHKMIFEFTPVGFKYIADRIVEGNTIFGAEESGGYCWKGNIPDRDGIITSLLFIEMMGYYGKSIGEIYKEIEKKYGRSYFIREDLSVRNVISKYSFAMKVKSKLGDKIMQRKIKEIITLDGIKVILDNDWWFLIRPSGTEPLLRIYVETDNQKSSKELINFAKELSSSIIEF